MSHSPGKALFYLKRTVGLLLLIALALVFFYSAYSKLFSGFHFNKSFFGSNDNFFVDAFAIDYDAFDAFRWNFLDILPISITTAGVLARLAIGLEFLIGLFLLLHIFLRKITYPLIIGLLSFFILYLIYTIILRGNTGNCGCFGNKLQMTPLMAIWKNLLMIIATVLLFYLYPVKPYKTQEWLSIFIGMIAFVAPFIITPLHEDITPASVVNEPIDLSPLYQATTTPTVELRKGKHIVAFMSLTCKHCQKAAYLLQMIHHQNPGIPIYFVLSGHPDQQKDFFKETKAENVPHILFTNSAQFILFTQHPKEEKHWGVPAIYWINNSLIERKSTYYQLDPKEMNEWLKQ